MHQFYCTNVAAQHDLLARREYLPLSSNGAPFHFAKPYNVLILGASYGSLLATKILAAGHNATLVCLPAEVDAFNTAGARVRMPVKGKEGLVEVHSGKPPGKLSVEGPSTAKPAEYDLVALAMQEPQYHQPACASLHGCYRQGESTVHVHHEHAAASVPGADSGISVKELRSCYTDPMVWDGSIRNS